MVAVTTAHTVQTLANKNLGSMGNRMDAAGEHIKNDWKTGVKTVGVLGTSVATVALAAKKPDAAFKVVQSVCSTIARIGQKLSIKNYIKLSEFGDAFCQCIDKSKGFLARNKGTAVVAAAATVVTALALNHISNKASYNAGKIDQKYADRANAQQVAK